VHPRLRVAGPAAQRAGGRRRAAAVVLLLCALVGVAPAGAAVAATAGAGTVVGWGSNSSGQASPPAGLTGVTAIAAGDSHSLALKSDGTVVAWGFNGWGQTDVPAGLSGVVAIAAGADHSLALQGPRYAWAGFSSPVANPPAVNPVTAGRAIPVTFSLGGDQGLDIFRSGYPASAAYPCGGSTPADATEPTVTAGASGLSYDPATDRYTYVWKTDKAWAGTCRALVIRLADGSPAKTATFRFTR
jgi:Regulator of chromosome condensation (RCC1) repeat